MKNIDDTSINEEIADGTVLVDFYTEWCSPCKSMSQLLSKISSNFTQIEFKKIDAEENFASVQKYNIKALPTLIIFTDGEEVEQIEGMVSQVKLETLLTKHAG